MCISHLGMVTNGEHNSLRMQGNTRPLQILQVRSEARAKIAKKQPKILLAMLTPKGTIGFENFTVMKFSRLGSNYLLLL